MPSVKPSSTPIHLIRPAHRAPDHPDEATGYRIEHAGKVLSYLTDTELCAGGCETKLLELARGADLMIYDCTFTEAEIATRAGRAHSTWQQGVRLAEAAGVKTFCLFHHDPEHDDAFMDVIAGQATAARLGRYREGSRFHLEDELATGSQYEPADGCSPAPSREGARPRCQIRLTEGSSDAGTPPSRYRSCGEAVKSNTPVFVSWAAASRATTCR